jgi:hypothetical protein
MWGLQVRGGSVGVGQGLEKAPQLRSISGTLKVYCFLHRSRQNFSVAHLLDLLETIMGAALSLVSR